MRDQQAEVVDVSTQFQTDYILCNVQMLNMVIDILKAFCYVLCAYISSSQQEMIEITYWNFHSWKTRVQYGNAQQVLVEFR